MITTSSVALQKAQAYLNRLVAAGATLTTAQRAGVTALAKALGDIGITKFSAVYPLIGASAACHALDLIGAYDITWSGTITHDANGITGDGTTGYGNTGLTPSTHPLDVNSHHASVYNRTNAAAGGTNRSELGAYDGTNFLLVQSRRTDNLAVGHAHAASAQFTPSTTAGLFTVSRTAAGSFFLDRSGGAQSNTSTTAPGGLINRAVYLLAYNNAGTANSYSTSNLSFSSIGSGLTSAEVLTLYTAVQALQTVLARNV